MKKLILIAIVALVVVFFGYSFVRGIINDGIRNTYFSANGSVNMQVVNTVKEHLPAQSKAKFLNSMHNQIDSAVSKGVITQSQGAALKKAFGIS